MEKQPLVSVGVPVYNGEKGIVRALDSLIEQDYNNLEIIISDNGSTDTTPQICKEYELKDSRIRYHRSKKNLGVAWNFNRVVELSSGKYFIWAAHDDVRDRAFVSSGLEKMELNPQAVACHIGVTTSVIGQEEILYTTNLDGIEGLMGLKERYKETLWCSPATLVYGFFRLSAIRKTRLLQNIIATDLAFIQELSILGPFIQVSKELFNYTQRESWRTVDEYYYTYLGKKRKPWWYFPFVAVFYDHWSRVAGSGLPASSKFSLWGILIEHQLGQVALKILIKIGRQLCPEKLKLKLGCAIYWRWMHPPNISIHKPDVFLETIIKPRLGWWG